MYGFFSENFLGFMTTQPFGNSVSIPNFEVFPIARKQHAYYLWIHHPEGTLKLARKYVQQMQISPPDPSLDVLPFAQANKD